MSASERIELREDLQALLVGASGQVSADDLFAAVATLQGETFRHVKGRRTLRFELGGRSWFLKWHDGVGWHEIIKNLLSFRLPIIGAEPEYRAIRRFHQLGLPTMQVAGFGQRGWNPARQQSFLITEDLSPAISLEDLCASWPQQPPLLMFKRALIDAVADIARAMHQNGIAHRDFYLCHFLLDLSGRESAKPVGEVVSHRTNSHPHLSVIDLHRALLRPPLSPRWIIKDIGGLYSSALDINLSRSDRARFITRYAGKNLRAALDDDGHFWNAVKERAARITRRDQRKAIGRALRGIYRSDTRQCRRHTFDRLAVYRREYEGNDLQAFIAEPDAFMAQGLMLKDGDSTTVVQVRLDGREYVAKRYNLRSFGYGLRRLFRRSRASQCWRSAYLLEFAGIDTPAPVMMLERRWGPFRRRAYFVTEFRSEPAVPSLTREFAEERGDAVTLPDGPFSWQGLADHFDELLARMRRFGIFHGDMKITNFLMGARQLVVLDLDATGRPRRRRSFQRRYQKDLRRLLANWTELPAHHAARTTFQSLVARAERALREQP